jgi:hypothetical protein
MSGSQPRDTPLAWSQTGEPIELPETAALWRVRRLTGNGKGGAPETVYNADGLPLAVDITISVADFQEEVDRKPGKYRLDALDENRRALQGIPAAYCMVSGEQAEPRASSSGDVALKTLADVFVRQSAQVSALIDACTRLVGAVDAAGVSRREPVPIVVAAPVAVRNGTEPDQDDDEPEEDEDDAPESAPDAFERVTDFCARVPPENLRMVMQHGPDLVADGITRFIQRGVVGLLPVNPADPKDGGAS